MPMVVYMDGWLARDGAVTRCSESKSLKIEGTVHYFVLQQRVFMMCMEGWLSGGRSVSRHGKPGITAAACG